MDPHDLAVVAAAISADALGRDPGEEFDVAMPEAPTIGGRPADATIVASILADGLRRDGVEILQRADGTWRCRRLPPTA